MKQMRPAKKMSRKSHVPSKRVGNHSITPAPRLGDKILLRLGFKANVEASFPGVIQGEGDAKVGFQLPTWMGIGILKRYVEQTNRNKTIEN